MIEEKEVLEKAKKNIASKEKRVPKVKVKSKLLTDMIDIESVQAHKIIKTKNPSYPSLPKFLLNRRHKTKAYKDKGLQESVLRGFYQRVSNWHKTNTLIFTPIEGE